MSEITMVGVQVGPLNLDDIYEEPTEFSVILIDGGPNKLQAIKVVRELTGLALKEAKDLVEAAPKACIKDSIPKIEAHEMKAKLEAVGCKVELR